MCTLHNAHVSSLSASAIEKESEKKNKMFRMQIFHRQLFSFFYFVNNRAHIVHTHDSLLLLTNGQVNAFFFSFAILRSHLQWNWVYEKKKKLLWASTVVCWRQSHSNGLFHSPPSLASPPYTSNRHTDRLTALPGAIMDFMPEPHNSEKLNFVCICCCCCYRVLVRRLCGYESVAALTNTHHTHRRALTQSLIHILCLCDGRRAIVCRCILPLGA